MNGKMFALVAIPLLLAIVGAVVVLGVKKYGTPQQFRERQEQLRQAEADSLAAIAALESPENVADSTLIGISLQGRMVEDTNTRAAELAAIQASIDSLERLKAEITSQTATALQAQEALTAQVANQSDENIAKLALLYDGMKTTLAVPLFIEMEDTLAVRILMRMQTQAGSRLIGAIAQKDVGKAARLNKLLAERGTKL